MVVLAFVDDLDSARKEAERASYLLDYGIDEVSLEEPSLAREIQGPLISVHRTAHGRFEISSFLGAEQQVGGALRKARQFFPAAEIRQVTKPGEPRLVPYRRTGVVIAGSYGTYEAALSAADELATASEFEIGTRGLVYSAEYGLHWPDGTGSGETWSFFPRRYDDSCGDDRAAPCLTVEPSAAYRGFAPGYYILVAGVLSRGPARAQRLESVRTHVPDAFVKETNLWFGCTR